MKLFLFVLLLVLVSVANCKRSRYNNYGDDYGSRYQTQSGPGNIYDSVGNNGNYAQAYASGNGQKVTYVESRPGYSSVSSYSSSG
ncbi:hypothetical protein TKK_0009589 [Trichogramma kaykai]